MEQKRASEGGAPGPEHDPSASSRPAGGEQSDSNLSTPLREDITAVPVTPGIHLSTFDEPEPSSGLDDGATPAGGSGSPGYFAKVDRRLVASPDSIDTSVPTAQSPGEAATGAKSAHDILRRMSLAAMGRRESISDIRARNPDLALSGNIISATFTIPYSLEYRTGKDWVSYI